MKNVKLHPDHVLFQLNSDNLIIKMLYLNKKNVK